MARTTFGPAGQKYTISDGTLEVFDQTTAERFKPVGEPVTFDHTGAVVTDNGFDRDFEQTDKGPAGVDSEPLRSATNTGTYTDPNTATGTRTKRKYTRRARTNTGTGASADTKTAFVTSNLEKVLYNLHKMAAGLLSEPTIAIGEDEAALLAEAVKEVAEAYDFGKVMDPRYTSLIDLAIACTTVYGARVGEFLLRPRNRKQPTVINATPMQRTN